MDKEPTLLQLHLKILEDPNLDFEQKKAMLNELRKLMPPHQNRWILRYIILALALVVLSIPVYAFTLLRLDPPGAQFPEALLSIGSTALGALATFLTHYTQKPSDRAQGSSTQNSTGV